MTGELPNLPFIDLVPSEWFKDPKASSIWVRGYWARPILPHHMPTPRVVIPLTRALAVLIQGSVTYFFADRPDIEPIQGGQARFRTPRRHGLIATPVGPHVLVIAPHCVDGVEAKEHSTEAQLDELEGLLTGYSGRAVVYQRLFDNILHLGTGQLTIFFGSVDNPAWYDPPDLRSAELTALTDVDRARASALPDLKSRIDLSLRWLAYAARDRAIDAFLKYWVAIETLSMPDSTNVRPANELLASVYAIPLQDAAQRFGLGRLQGVRAAIVHRGVRVEIPGEVEKFLEAVYFDLLTAVLGIPGPKRASLLLHQGSFSVQSWLSQIGASG